MPHFESGATLSLTLAQTVSHGSGASDPPTPTGENRATPAIERLLRFLQRISRAGLLRKEGTPHRMKMGK
jgi:hypothetical protein